ncbi:hypothetical protein L0664_11420 [Octadecabacter sp. G9-8]|uniref:Uncharacterized protein n=1 Tax=Octadecabacter dasysiphoniae TaxID=2909341 RepID=A0ABS9CXL6_9RHOB|nr:hypothetical protein [Octadecabacter dasysiphoniae]MCF2871676.1 hypothetical protein [Octadecabacter dasysiphoniae]
MMKRVMSLTTAAILCASQVSALSCMRPDAARTFQWASDAEESYVVLMGEFAFDAPNADGSDMNNPQEISVPARFAGSYLGADGFVGGAALDLMITFTCAGPWCGSLEPNGEEMIAFVQQADSGYVLEIGPCYGNTFSNPRAGAMQQVESCMRGEGCEEGALMR